MVSLSKPSFFTVKSRARDKIRLACPAFFFLSPLLLPFYCVLFLHTFSRTLKNSLTSTIFFLNINVLFYSKVKYKTSRVEVKNSYGVKNLS